MKTLTILMLVVLAIPAVAQDTPPIDPLSLRSRWVGTMVEKNYSNAVTETSMQKGNVNTDQAEFDIRSLTEHELAGTATYFRPKCETDLRFVHLDRLVYYFEEIKKKGPCINTIIQIKFLDANKIKVEVYVGAEKKPSYEATMTRLVLLGPMQNIKQ